MESAEDLRRLQISWTETRRSQLDVERSEVALGRARRVN